MTIKLRESLILKTARQVKVRVQLRKKLTKLG